MRRFITSAALAFSLFGMAGMADARGFDRPVERGHGVVVRQGGVRDGAHFRDYGHRPERVVEHGGFRAGYSWHAGDWQWNGYEWIWTPGYYVRVVL
jgi:hypothetical protein